MSLGEPHTHTHTPFLLSISLNKQVKQAVNKLTKQNSDKTSLTDTSGESPQSPHRQSHRLPPPYATPIPKQYTTPPKYEKWAMPTPSYAGAPLWGAGALPLLIRKILKFDTSIPPPSISPYSQNISTITPPDILHNPSQTSHIHPYRTLPIMDTPQPPTDFTQTVYSESVPYHKRRAMHTPNLLTYNVNM